MLSYIYIVFYFFLYNISSLLLFNKNINNNRFINLYKKL